MISRLPTIRDHTLSTSFLPNEISCYDDRNEYSCETEPGEYMVLTEDEADDMVEQQIKDSVWAFNKSFLNSHSMPIANMTDACFMKIQEMCEDANETILRLIDDVEHFINDAIMWDGRGHFLSSYDGQENEVQIGKKYYFIYRTN